MKPIILLSTAIVLLSCKKEPINLLEGSHHAGDELSICMSHDVDSLHDELGSKKEGDKKIEELILDENKFVNDVWYPQTFTSIKGDFNGDGIEERLKEKLVRKSDHSSLDSFPDGYPYGLVGWIDKQDPKCYLKSYSEEVDDLPVADNPMFGLAYLINMGDLNQDGGDEVAFVIDHADFSNLNSCQIWSFCGGNWNKVFHFGIHEGSLYSEEDVSKGIPEYLIQRNGVWYYLDYYKQESHYSERTGEYELWHLELEPCN